MPPNPKRDPIEEALSELNRASVLPSLLSKRLCEVGQRFVTVGEIACRRQPVLFAIYCSPPPPPPPTGTPDVTAVKTNDVNVETPGEFNWTIRLENIGIESAVFQGSGTVVLRDELPAGAVYSNVQVVNGPTAGGPLDCQINSLVLVCVIPDNSTAYSLGGGGGFATISFHIAPTGAGSLANPDGICRVDPDSVLTELLEDNNDCADTVTIVDAS